MRGTLCLTPCGEVPMVHNCGNSDFRLSCTCSVVAESWAATRHSAYHIRPLVSASVFAFSLHCVHPVLSPSSGAKMSYSEKPSKAIDLSHHLSDVSRARGVSPLKGLARYLERPGMISLAGGMHLSMRTRRWFSVSCICSIWKT